MDCTFIYSLLFQVKLVIYFFHDQRIYDLFCRLFRLSSLIGYGGAIYALYPIMYRFVESSIAYGLIALISILFTIYFLLVCFDERESWITYTRFHYWSTENQSKPISINWRIWILGVILPLIFCTLSYSFGYAKI